MATFEDPIQEEEIEQVEEEVVEEQQEPQEETTPEPELPGKYQGKSIADIVKMHQEAEKLIGKQAQEVGEVRKLADELLKRELYQKQNQQAPQEKEIDLNEKYLEDPVGAVNSAIDSHPAIKEAQQQAMSYKQQQVTQRLNQEFSNFNEVIEDPKFYEWINASPIRTRLFTEAHTQYDYDSAKELLSTWNTLNPSKPQQDTELVTEAKIETQKGLKAAAVDTGSPAPSSRKIYRRSDLINLRVRDPARYEAMADEIMAAYAEQRVK